ncbi:MAG: hypothetical protein DKM23_07620 [Candidatus Melainabacteria bacterium]|nr:MAG: hypothetical protein DKM24_08275 [Candidatus Melainabacteria bacterium]RAI10195.1 MAG: hypothetical protein DKM23_07620 [Candidatus Melainabacteria bacterium]
MNELQKYKESLMYLAGIIVVAVFLFQKIQPEFTRTIDLYKQVGQQKDVAAGISKQLSVAKEKVERKKKMRLLDDMTKKVYSPAEGVSLDADSAFSVLLDDIIEISRKNHIKTHSIQSTLNPSEDVFVKGDKEHFSAYQLDMKIVSDYSDFEGFIRDLYAYNYLININNIEIYPYQKNKRILLINLTLTLYSTIAAPDANGGENNGENNGEGGENNGDQQQGENPPPPTP